jgi:hypothetical protein
MAVLTTPGTAKERPEMPCFQFQHIYFDFYPPRQDQRDTASLYSNDISPTSRQMVKYYDYPESGAHVNDRIYLYSYAFVESQWH